MRTPSPTQGEGGDDEAGVAPEGDDEAITLERPPPQRSMARAASPTRSSDTADPRAGRGSGDRGRRAPSSGSRGTSVATRGPESDERTAPSRAEAKASSTAGSPSRPKAPSPPGLPSAPADGPSSDTHHEHHDPFRASRVPPPGPVPRTTSPTSCQ